MKKVLITLVGALVATSTAFADMPTAKGDNQWHFGIGVGVESQISPYLGVDDQTGLIPAIMIEKGNFSLRGPNMNYRLFDNQKLSVSALARIREESLESNDSDELDGIEDRDTTLEVGFGLGYKTAIGDVNFKIYNDAEGTHDGFETSLGLQNKFRLSQGWSLTPTAQVSYRSEDLNDYYFGVSDAEATAERSAYTAGSTTSFQVGVAAQYKISRQQMLILDAKYSTLGGEIEDSPIVDASSFTGVKAIYIYRF